MLHCVSKEEPTSNRKQLSVGQITPKRKKIVVAKACNQMEDRNNNILESQ
jgi:hypothetical protein